MHYYVSTEITSGNDDYGWVSEADFWNRTQGDIWSSGGNDETTQKNNHCYVPKITFTYTTPSVPDTPDDLAVSATTQTTATLGWTAVSGATSYDLQYSTDNENWSNLVTSHTSTSYEMTGLTANTTYYVKICANNATGSSDYSDAVSFTTDAVHSHNGISFTKWNSTTSLPTSGNYYLAADVTPSGVSGTEISGTLNLCLNGHSVTYTGAAKGISVTSTGSLSIYDNVGGGLITSEHGTATIQVASGGSLALHAGNVTNTGEGTPLTFNGAVYLDLTEAASNATYLSLANGHTVDVNLSRSFTSASYNTICLPFALTNTQLKSIFGSPYDLEEFDSSALDGEELVLTFNKVTSLTAGKPYLIQPAANVANPSFAGVTISTTSPVDQTSDTYISFHGVFNPTSLEGGNKNLLFLGAANELFYPAATDNINGFRAYFEVKGSAQKVAKRARIANGTNTATGISDVQRDEVQCTKILRDGQIVIIRQGAEYNAQGIRTK
ncbi:MAG: fibronectin type III domain-containing protein [Paludibacteraceae bacterium]|nr:fibronectin type III domain-containing protein [Paludibacteraceae bacterium]